MGRGSRLWRGMGLSALIWAGVALAADSPLPSPVREWIDRLPALEAATETVDITGDGRADYVVRRLMCKDAGLETCNPLGPVGLFVTGPDGSVRHIMDVQALAYRIDASSGGAPVLVFETHEADEPVGSFDSYKWNGRSFARIGRRSMAMPPLGPLPPSGD